MASVTSLKIYNLGIEVPTGRTGYWSGVNRSISGKIRSSSSSSSGTTHYEGILKLTNTGTTRNTLRFNYSVVTNTGTVILGYTGTSSDVKLSDVTNQLYEKQLDPGESIQIYIKSNSINNYTQIDLTDIWMVSAGQVTLTFPALSGISYKVNGQTIASDVTLTQQSTTPIQLQLASSKTLDFLGWTYSSDNRAIAYGKDVQIFAESSGTILPYCVENNVPVFEANDIFYTDLNKMFERESEEESIYGILAHSGILSSGQYVIPKKCSLSLENRDAGYERNASQSTPFLVKSLVVPANTTITVEGSLYTYSDYATGVGLGGTPCGPYTTINLCDVSSIINVVGTLSCKGFILGRGKVVAQSGATIVEIMQAPDYRGGQASNALANKVYFFSQYYVQNIECELTLQYGGNLQSDVYLYAQSSTNTSNSLLVSTENTAAMFCMQPGSTLTKRYNRNTDKIEIVTTGNVYTGNFRLSMAGYTMSAISYVFPISNAWTIKVTNGSLTVASGDICLLPGSILDLSDGGSLVINENVSTSTKDGVTTETHTPYKVYLYGWEDWMQQNFCLFDHMRPAVFVPDRKYIRTDTDIKTDAKILGAAATISGLGCLYKTNNYKSQIEPTVTLTADGGITNTYQYTQGQNAKLTLYTIPVTAVK